MKSASASVSVLMPSFNPGPYLQEAVGSVLDQPQCLELIVADGGSTDGSVDILEALARTHDRLKLHVAPDLGPADALNTAFRKARGTLIGWLNADDLYPPGALARAVAALTSHPDWLMVYGEGEEFNVSSGSRQRYPTQQPTVGLEGFRSNCFICQPTVVFRRSMGILLGPFDTTFKTAFDFDYWMRAFSAFPSRIGYVPHVQGLTRIHETTITSSQRAQVAIEAMRLLARHFGHAPATRINNYARELQLGLASKPAEESLENHLTAVFREAEPYLQPHTFTRLRRAWLLDPATAPIQRDAERQAKAKSCHRSLPVRLLQALRPQLSLDAPGPPAGPHLRLQAAIEQAAADYPLLNGIQGAALPNTPATIPFCERPFGVNLIGHAFDVFGIGEDIRMAARSLEAAGVPCCVIDHPAGNGAARTDGSLADLIHGGSDGGPFAYNLVCMAAPIQARWLLRSGFSALRERYTLAAWPWETRGWPHAWQSLLEVADELWPSSRFTAAALLPHSHAGLPLQWMPMAAEVPHPERYSGSTSRQACRQRHGLPSEDVLFVYGFDLNSTATRKNPFGALEAFQQAFPTDRDDELARRVALVIKTFPPRRPTAEVQWLQARAAEDDRIHLVVASLDREELLSLYGCCDVFLSLHRSEGFGRGMAEALQLGLDVIATEYGGNTDFCTGLLAHPVRYTEVPIPRGSYPCADGHHWAEPDICHACALIRKVTQNRLAAQKGEWSPMEKATSYYKRFAHETVGRRYRDRLEQIWGERQQVGKRLRWRADRSPISP